MLHVDKLRLPTVHNIFVRVIHQIKNAAFKLGIFFKRPTKFVLLKMTMVQEKYLRLSRSNVLTFNGSLLKAFLNINQHLVNR